MAATASVRERSCSAVFSSAAVPPANMKRRRVHIDAALAELCVTNATPRKALSAKL
jgi:hypothetical protein